MNTHNINTGHRLDYINAQRELYRAILSHKDILTPEDMAELTKHINEMEDIFMEVSGE